MSDASSHPEGSRQHKHEPDRAHRQAPQRHKHFTVDYDKHPHLASAKEHIEHQAEMDFDPETNPAFRVVEHERNVSLGKKKRTVAAADIAKLVGLIAFFALIIVVCAWAWPKLMAIYQDGGVQGVIDLVRGAGGKGVLVLFLLQCLQIIVAFIPGELTQIAAGIMYGPWFGSLLILAGCIVAGALVYQLVQKLGAPFVRSMVGEESLDRFREFERSGKLGILIFVLFLIPGLPKDAFTYLAGLTDMKMSTFLLISTVARTPAVVVSAWSASALVSGHTLEGIISFIVLGAIAVLVILFRDSILEIVDRFK